MAFAALVLAIIAAAVAWFDKAISTAHLFVFVFVILALLAGHLVYRGRAEGWL